MSLLWLQRNPLPTDWVMQGKQELTVQIKEPREDTRITTTR